MSAGPTKQQLADRVDELTEQLAEERSRLAFLENDSLGRVAPVMLDREWVIQQQLDEVTADRDFLRGLLSRLIDLPAIVEVPR